MFKLTDISAPSWDMLKREGMDMKEGASDFTATTYAAVAHTSM